MAVSCGPPETLEISTALGRRNYLFCGSHRAAGRATVLYSLTRTCAQYRVPPLPYLTDVLRKLAGGWPQSHIAELCQSAGRPLQPFSRELLQQPRFARPATVAAAGSTARAHLVWPDAYAETAASFTALLARPT